MTYDDENWVNWSDWLGTENRKPKRVDWMPFLEAREYARSSGVEVHSDWPKAKNPSNIPKSPHVVYKDEGWVNWPDWLGAE